MQKYSFNYKIYLAAAVWLILCALMYFYFFGLFDKSTNAILDNIWKQSKELKLLKAEQDSYRLAKEDLEKINTKSLKPEDFFSKDITLVKEIKVLETLGDKYGVDMGFSGVSGIANAAPKAKTISDIAIVPYSISLQGTFANVVNAIEALENLDFITNLSALSASTGLGDNINVSLNASFYLRRK